MSPDNYMSCDMPPRVTAPHKLTPLPWEHGFCKSQTLSSTDRLLLSILSFSWRELVRICVQRVQSMCSPFARHGLPELLVSDNRSQFSFVRSVCIRTYLQTQSMRVISIICMLQLFNGYANIYRGRAYM